MRYTRQELTDLIVDLTAIAISYDKRLRSSLDPSMLLRQAGVYFRLADEYRDKGLRCVEQAKQDVAERSELIAKVAEHSLVLDRLEQLRRQRKTLSREELNQLQAVARKLASRMNNGRNRIP